MSSGVLMQLVPASLKPGAALRILPSGAFRSHDGRPASLESSRITDWYIDAEIAAQVMRVPPPNGQAFVLDYEHQTLNKEKNGQPAPAAGWFKALEWREGQGLFISGIEWTERASSMIAAKEYRYLSAVFRFNPQTGAVTGMHSVALTNDPALVGLGDLAAATSRPTQLAATSVLTMDERANFLHAFGHIPGFNLPSAEAQAATTAHAQHAAQQVVMSEQERENFKFIFGWDPLVGSPT